ncbi:hypothetical protein [Planctomicrobium piriforme]|uniref:hypothetical protein n=1 Tax=Planctomicrobium piriforme TaxID=1576369 RepID=UPI000B89DC2A|nr:hypothetical protein [Planctomicrobium piriforme]
MQHERSEKVKCSFTHACETESRDGRGFEKINKRFRIVTAARDLELLILMVFGIGKARVSARCSTGIGPESRRSISSPLKISQSA